MKKLREIKVSLPQGLAIDLDVLVCRYGVTKKEVVIALLSAGITTLKVSDSFQGEVDSRLKAEKPLTETLIPRTEIENDRYTHMLEENLKEKFKQEEERIQFINGIGDY